MRTEEAMEGWRLSGRIPGAGQEDAAQEDIRLPFALEHFENLASREGMFLRAWELSREISRPQDPPHSRAERVLLTLDGVCGQGVLHLNENLRAPLEPQMELDVTEMLRDGPFCLTLRFDPHFPHLYSGERGRDLPVEVSVMSVRVRSVFLLRIDALSAESSCVCVKIHAYGAGKVRLCLRLMEEERLIWSENSELRIAVGDQIIERPFDPGTCRSGRLCAVIDMGGEGCDEREILWGKCAEMPKSWALLRAFPQEGILEEIRRAGFDGVVVAQPESAALRTACARQRLHLRFCTQNAVLPHPLLRPDTESMEGNAAWMAPLRSERPEDQLLQAVRLCNAVSRLRAENRTFSLLALTRQKDAPDGLFDAKGKPHLALHALYGVLSRIAVLSVGQEKLCYPGGAFEVDIYACTAVPDEGAAVIDAQLYLWDGTLAARHSYPVSLNRPSVYAGRLKTQLPWGCCEGLMLRLQCWRSGVLAAQNHCFYAFADENGKRRSFPLVDLTEGEEGGVRVLYNASAGAAVCVTVRADGKYLLRGGALLPQERLVLAQDAAVVVEYGNPVERGGASIVSQRIL